VHSNIIASIIDTIHVGLCCQLGLCPQRWWPNSW